MWLFDILLFSFLGGGILGVLWNAVEEAMESWRAGNVQQAVNNLGPLTPSLPPSIAKKE